MLTCEAFPEASLICLVRNLTCPTCVSVCVSPASSGPVSVDNVVLKATCSLSAYKYLPPPLVDHSTNASGEKHVLLLWTPVKVLHVVYVSSLCCQCSVTEGVCRHPSAAAADGADGAAVTS